MRFTLRTFSNVWYVNGSEVDNIIIYDNIDGGRILLEMDQRWIPFGAPGANAIDTLDEVTEIAKRNKVNLSRLEHFAVVSRRNKYSPTSNILYLNAALFSGASNVMPAQAQYSDEFHTVFRANMQILTRVNGEETPRWLTLWNHGATYVDSISPLGELCDSIAARFNEKVAGHTNNHITRSGAKRLLEILPALNAMATASGINL